MNGTGAGAGQTDDRPGGRRLAIDLGPLRRHRDFRLLFIGQAATALGSMITFVAVPFQLYELTGSSLLVGSLGLVEFVAMLSVAFVGGALADSVDRRRMVQWTEGALMGCSALLLANTLLDRPQVWVLFVMAGLATLFSALQRPSLEAMLPRLVPAEDVLAAGALGSLRGTGAMLAGPALGGILIAGFGLRATYAFDVATFALSLVALGLMRPVPPAADAERPSWRAVRDGLRYARSRPELLGTYLVDINAMFFGMPHALFPAIATAFGGAQVLGLLYTAPALGALAATATSGWTARVERHGLAVILAAGSWGVAIVGFGLAGRLWMALVFLGLAGAADMISGLFRMAIWNTTIPDHLRGRLAGIEMISYTSGPMLGNVEAGVVAGLTSPAASVTIGGVASVAGTAILAAVLPQLRRYRKPTANAAAEPAHSAGHGRESP